VFDRVTSIYCARLRLLHHRWRGHGGAHCRGLRPARRQEGRDIWSLSEAGTRELAIAHQPAVVRASARCSRVAGKRADGTGWTK